MGPGGVIGQLQAIWKQILVYYDWLKNNLQKKIVLFLMVLWNFINYKYGKRNKRVITLKSVQLLTSLLLKKENIYSGQSNGIKCASLV